MLRLGVIGCGDVYFRSYAEGVRAVADRAHVVACCDPDDERAARGVALSRSVGAEADAYGRLEDLLDRDDLDGVLNLTPAPLHHEVSLRALEAGLSVYSEKPLAATLEQADELIAVANRAQLALMCAPAAMATSRLRWMQRLFASGLIGMPTIAVGQLATLGPAAWRAYTGDPRVFYSDAVGPVADLGVYLLHAVTGLLGRVTAVQSVESLAIAERVVLGDGPVSGRPFTVEAPDTAILLLHHANGAVSQLLTGFGTPASRAPFLEVHCTGGTVSTAAPFLANGPVDLWRSDDSPVGVEGWTPHANATAIPSPVEDMIACGVVHFTDVLLGREAPVLTAAHGRHVIDVRLAAHRAAETGTACAVESSFADDAPLLSHVAG
jgi:predicted dehydrogenase